MVYDIIIIGSGPSGLTAAIYTSRANLKTLLIAGTKWGGQLMLTTEVENFPGFPKGILGPELMGNMRIQAQRFGTEIKDEPVISVDFSKKPFSVITSSGVYKSKSVIVATGADTRWLGVPGEAQFIGKGISSCAPCDAFFYRGKEVIVVGGGDSAMEEALVLTKFATKIYIMHRGPTFRASKIMQDRVLKHEKIHEFYNTQIVEVMGRGVVDSVRVRTFPTDKTLLSKTLGELSKILPEMVHVTIESKDSESITFTMPIQGVFVAIGHSPNTKIFKDILPLDDKGYIKRISNVKFKMTNEKGEVIGNKYPSMSPVEGVFIAGDVQDYQYRQAVTAAGYGCMAALDAEKWIADTT